MKAFKIEILVINYADLSESEIKRGIENTCYPNHNIYPEVKKIESRDIGEVEDWHPLNDIDTCDQAYIDLFKESE